MDNTKITRHCDECEYGNSDKPAALVCDKGHKPKWYMPKSGIDTDWGYKRKCAEFSAKVRLRCKMNPRDLIVDLRSRINPAYADWPGTESYERNLCVEVLEAQASEIDQLRNMLSETSSLNCEKNPLNSSSA